MKRLLKCSLFITVMFAICCKQKYEPPVVKTDLDYLVVDGVLINGPDSTIIRLSRTKRLDKNPVADGELNAQMSVENSDGNVIYNFIPVNDKGSYTVPGMNLDINEKYRLRIRTTGGKEYISDDITVKETPPIDSISWQRQDDGVTIYVNTHDPGNNTKYYRWESSETWEYHSNFFSLLKYENGMILARAPDEYVFQCWQTRNSANLLLGSSAKLSQDIIHLNPIQFIAANSIELGIQYSILLNQYSLTKEGFEYFENLKKNTEQSGSIFDAQPAQLPGNIHCVNNADEVIVGFVTASSLQRKRIFISNQSVAPWNYLKKYCEKPIVIGPESFDSYFKSGILYLPIESDRGSTVKGGFASCIDCRLNGGTNIKPAFWP